MKALLLAKLAEARYLGAMQNHTKKKWVALALVGAIVVYLFFLFLNRSALPSPALLHTQAVADSMYLFHRLAVAKSEGFIANGDAGHAQARFIHAIDLADSGIVAPSWGAFLILTGPSANCLVTFAKPIPPSPELRGTGIFTSQDEPAARGSAILPHLAKYASQEKISVGLYYSQVPPAEQNPEKFPFIAHPQTRALFDNAFSSPSAFIYQCIL